MSGVKYSPLPTHDSGANSLQWGSPFSYSKPKESHSDLKKFQSAFTYSAGGPDDGMKIHAVDTAEATVWDRVLTCLVSAVCHFLVLLMFPITAWYCFKRLAHYERLVVFRLGRLRGAKGPGLVITLPCIDRLSRVDLRMKAFSIPPQKLLTSDGAIIEMGAEVFYRIKDAAMSVTNVQDLNHSSRIIAQTILSRQLSSRQLADIEAQSVVITDTLRNEINLMTLQWGVEVSKLIMSQVTVLAEPNRNNDGVANAVNILGQMLFSPGDQHSNLPSQIGKMMTPQILPPAPSSRLQPDKAGSSQLLTPDDLISKIRPHVTSDLVRRVGYVYRFLQSGTHHVFYLDLKNGEGSVGHGEPPVGSADVTLTLSLDLFRRLLMGESSALHAYMRGEMEVDGDMSAARSLSSLADLITR